MNNVSFKGYIPVKCYAKNEGENNYRRVYYDEQNNYLTKCQGQIVRNLNGTLKNKNDEFIKFYKSHDKDYAKSACVKSVYDKENSLTYMVSGFDANIVDNYAKTIGLTKAASKKYYGKSNTYYSKKATNDYFSNVFNFLKNSCKRVKTPDGDDLTLKVYFDTKRNKKDEIIAFKLVNAKFEKEA